MVKITIENLAEKEVHVNDLSRSVLRHLQDNSIDWMFACGAKGRCTTCRFIIVAGEDNILPFTEAELRYRSKGFLLANERLACQAKITGDVVIRVPDDSKLPHIQYS